MTFSKFFIRYVYTLKFIHDQENRQRKRFANENIFEDYEWPDSFPDCTQALRTYDTMKELFYFVIMPFTVVSSTIIDLCVSIL